MEKSADARVQKFLGDMQALDGKKYDILQNARAIVLTQAPKTSERFMYGGIMFSHNGDFGGVFASKNYVSFEFGQGYAFLDPDKRLEGGGKFRRHLKLRLTSDITTKNLDFFVKQALQHIP